MNNITVAGQLGKDSEIRTLSNGDLVLSFSVADSQGREKPTIWWRCSLFGKRAESLAPYLTKGASVTVTGQVTEREYQDKDGVQKKAQEADFEAALNDLKGKLNVIINPSQITPAGKGILQWPLDKVRITQYFGNTAFAASGSYNGKGHNGIDFAASIGTPVHASLSGVVLGTGNTDSVKGCYSFGKWVMIKHANGLNTMYAHLSQISVRTGEEVATGEVLGYSGETGYATGPHLHYGVYVSSATQIMTLGEATQQKTACANATMRDPAGSFSASARFVTTARCAERFRFQVASPSAEA